MRYQLYKTVLIKTNASGLQMSIRPIIFRSDLADGQTEFDTLNSTN